MEASQQRIVKVIKNEYAHAMKEVKHLFKELGSAAEVLRNSTAKGRKKSEIFRN